MQHHYFPESIIALQAEIQQHEELLLDLLALPRDAGIELKLGAVATYCDVVLDGVYGEADILQLCELLVKRLKRKRGMLVLEIVQSVPASPKQN